MRTDPRCLISCHLRATLVAWCSSQSDLTTPAQEMYKLAYEAVRMSAVSCGLRSHDGAVVGVLALVRVRQSDGLRHMIVFRIRNGSAFHL